MGRLATIILLVSKAVRRWVLKNARLSVVVILCLLAASAHADIDNPPNTDNVSEGSSNLYFTNERVDDRVDALVTDGNGITTSYNDGSNTLTFTADGAHCYNFFPTTPDGDVVAGTDLYRIVVRDAFTVTGVFAYVDTTGTTDVVTIDINEAGTTILSTKLTVDAGENDSTTALAAAVISDTAIADNAVLSVDVDDQDGGNTAAGLQVNVCGYY